MIRFIKRQFDKLMAFIDVDYESSGNSHDTPYQFAMSNVLDRFNRIEDSTDKKEFLKLVRKSVTLEMSTELINRPFYYGFVQDDSYRPTFSFNHYMEIDGRNESLYEAIPEEEYTCDFGVTPVLSFPWNPKRYVNTFHYISRDGFKHQNTNHFINYYPQLGLCTAFNGFHSISAGVISGEGTLPVHKVYDVTKTFKEVYTNDGKLWQYRTSGKVERIDDFRYALIYELSRMLWCIENKLPINVSEGNEQLV